MIRLAILLLLSVYAIGTLDAQSWSEVTRSKAYIWGQGYGSTPEEADDNAVKALVEKISMQVVIDSKLVLTEGNDRYSNVMNTYSAATLPNLQKLTLKNDFKNDVYEVGCWILAKDMDKIFDGRRAKITTMLESALRAEERGEVEYALKSYYWGLLLTNSLQFPNEFRFRHGDKEYVATTWILEQMNRIFSNLNFRVKKKDGLDVEMFVTYTGKPVSKLQFKYYDGRNWTSTCLVSDGVGVMEMVGGGDLLDKYDLRVEYQYRSEAHIDPEVESVMGIMKAIPMKASYFEVKGKEVNIKPTETNRTFADITSKPFYAKPEPLADNSAYRSTVENIVNRLRTNATYDVDTALFTKNGIDVYRKLIKYGSAKVVGEPNLTCYEYGNDIVVRGLRMSFTFKTGTHKNFVQDVVFTLNRDSKIDNISFGLGNTIETNVLGQSLWSEEARMAILQFLENYQTAYALKRLDYIESVFDEDAVIINGTVLKRPATNRDFGNIVLDDRVVKYSRYNKRTYMDYLKRSFASKEYINIRFTTSPNDAGSNHIVSKLAKGGEMYAIQLCQEYYSSNYGDVGYLFLIVDVNNPKEPIIKVRTWQPDRDPNFGLYGPEDFR